MGEKLEELLSYKDYLGDLYLQELRKGSKRNKEYTERLKELREQTTVAIHEINEEANVI